MEGEFNFLVFLPQAVRERTALYWYRGATGEAREYVYGKNAYLDAESAVAYRSGDPQRELYELLRQRLAPVLDARFDLAGVADARLRAELQALAAVQGGQPELAAGDERAARRRLQRRAALLHAAAQHRACQRRPPGTREVRAAAGREHADGGAGLHRRLPECDLSHGSAPICRRLRRRMRGPGSEADYRKLADRFAVRRTNPQFWAASDAMHDAYGAGRRWRRGSSTTTGSRIAERV